MAELGVGMGRIGNRIINLEAEAQRTKIGCLWQGSSKPSTITVELAFAA